MEVETKFLRLFKPVALGDRIDALRGRLAQVLGGLCRNGGTANAGYRRQTTAARVEILTRAAGSPGKHFDLRILEHCRRSVWALS